jgi:1-deoxyxylulose-5-phosphate synthase
MHVEYTKFGRTGLSVSRLSLGTATFGKQTDEKLSHEITGRWLKGKRARFILATKGGGPMGPSRWDQGSSRKHLLDAIDASPPTMSVYTNYISTIGKRHWTKAWKHWT